MKEIVDILLKRWQQRADGTSDRDTRVVCKITVFCLEQYKKFLTGGKRRNK